jgi:hypothetical protein
MPDDAQHPVATSPHPDDVRLQEILTELQRLNDARTHLYAFVKLTKADLTPAKHQVALCNFLDDLIAGRARDAEGRVTRNALILMPPRSAKSEFTSRKLIPFIVGRVEAGVAAPPATCENIVVSASESLARGDFGQSMRDCIESEQYRRAFPATTLSEKSAAGDEFKTARGSVVITRPLGGQIVGRGVSANGVLIIDDPYKSRADITPANLALVESYYRSVLIPRCKPGAVKILVQTAWDVRDLSAYVMNYNATGTSPFVKYATPAVTTDADGVDHSWYEEVFSIDAIKQIAADISASEFQAQYMCRPTNPEGTLYRREWFRYHTPGADFDIEECYCYASVDLSYSTGNDTAAIGVFAVDPMGQAFIVDVWFDKTGTLKATNALMSMCSKWYVRGIVFEKDPAWEPIWREIARTFKDATQRMPRTFPLTTYGGGNGKAGKAEAILLMLEKGLLFFPRETQCKHWPDAEQMLLAFDGREGGEDAVADVLSNFGRVAQVFVGRGVDPRTGLVNRQFGPKPLPYDPSKAFGGQLQLGDVNDTGMNVLTPDRSRY